jgi:hypothetical protein
MTTTHYDEDANYAALLELARALPEFLAQHDPSGLTWTFREHMRHGHHIERADGVKLWVRTGPFYRSAERGKAAISGAYPEGFTKFYFSPPLDNTGITVSMARGPVAIAKDIVRRALPIVVAETTRVRAALDADAGYKANQAAKVDAILAVLPGAVRSDDRPGDVNLYSVPGVSYGTAKVLSDSVSFDMTVSPQVAQAVFAAIAAAGAVSQETKG